MIIYAFYGLGKSNLAEKYPNRFTDADSEYWLFQNKLNEYQQFVQQQSDAGKIVLINTLHFPILNKQITKAFLPESLQISIKRLSDRKNANQTFLFEMQEQFVFVRNLLLNEQIPIVEIKENEYLSDYF